MNKKDTALKQFPTFSIAVSERFPFIRESIGKTNRWLEDKEQRISPTPYSDILTYPAVSAEELISSVSYGESPTYPDASSKYQGAHHFPDLAIFPAAHTDRDDKLGDSLVVLRQRKEHYNTINNEHNYEVAVLERGTPEWGIYLASNIEVMHNLARDRFARFTTSVPSPEHYADLYEQLEEEAIHAQRSNMIINQETIREELQQFSPEPLRLITDDYKNSMTQEIISEPIIRNKSSQKRI